MTRTLRTAGTFALGATLLATIGFLGRNALQRMNDADPPEGNRRATGRVPMRRLGAMNLAQYTVSQGTHDQQVDVVAREESSAGKQQQGAPPVAIEQQEPNDKPKSHCQIIYAVGVEGSMHHYVGNILLESLASLQRDDSGEPFVVHYMNKMFRCSEGFQHRKFESCKELGEDALTAKAIMDDVCPDDGRHHVIIEGVSYPSGVNRLNHDKWTEPDDIATRVNRGRVALDLRKVAEFVQEESGRRDDVEIFYVLLWRNFAGAVASHSEWDSSKRNHANALAGNLLYLSRLFEERREDGTLLFPRSSWKVLCVDSLSNAKVRTDAAVQLAEFFRWTGEKSVTKCPKCHYRYRQSNKVPREVLGEKDHWHVKRLVARYRNRWWAFLGRGVGHTDNLLDPARGACPAIINM